MCPGDARAARAARGRDGGGVNFPRPFQIGVLYGLGSRPLRFGVHPLLDDEKVFGAAHALALHDF